MRIFPSLLGAFAVAATLSTTLSAAGELARRPTLSVQPIGRAQTPVQVDPAVTVRVRYAEWHVFTLAQDGTPLGEEVIRIRVEHASQGTVDAGATDRRGPVRGPLLDPYGDDGVDPERGPQTVPD